MIGIMEGLASGFVKRPIRLDVWDRSGLKADVSLVVPTGEPRPDIPGLELTNAGRAGATYAEHGSSQLYFSVELHTDAGIEEVVARCSRVDMERAAYRVACTAYPKRLVMLCRRAQIVERNDRIS
jgi:hypothetical protein